MPVLDQITKAQDKFFANVDATNDRVADTVGTLVKRMPEVQIPFADRVTVPTIPFIDQLPAPIEVVDAYFDFVSRSVEANRSFAEKVVTSVAPASAKPAAAKPATAKAAPKAAAKKAPAKKKAAAKKTTAKKA